MFGSTHHNTVAQLAISGLPLQPGHILLATPFHTGNLRIEFTALPEVSAPQVSHGRRSLDVSDVPLWRGSVHRCSSLACLEYVGSILIFWEEVKGLSALLYDFEGFSEQVHVVIEEYPRGTVSLLIIIVVHNHDIIWWEFLSVCGGPEPVYLPNLESMPVVLKAPGNPELWNREV